MEGKRSNCHAVLSLADLASAVDNHPLRKGLLMPRCGQGPSAPSQLLCQGVTKVALNEEEYGYLWSAEPERERGREKGR